MRRDTEVFVARQPIVDRRRQMVAYELLFRDDGSGIAHVSDAARASAQVIGRVFHQLGMDTVLGPCTGFINVDAELLMSRSLESLPRERVVLELLETVTVDDEIVQRCAQLKRLGYRMALDDFCAIAPAYEPLLELVDIVKIDILELDADSLAQLVRQLQRYPARLLAEKVDTLEKARRCLALGFDLFQGFFFCRPQLMSA